MKHSKAFKRSHAKGWKVLNLQLKINVRMWNTLIHATTWEING